MGKDSLGYYKALKSVTYCGMIDLSKVNSTYPAQGSNRAVFYAVNGLYRYKKIGLIDEVILTNVCSHNKNIKGKNITCKYLYNRHISIILTTTIYLTTL